MKFNVFLHLLYSKHMNTLDKESWSKWGKKAGMFVKDEVLHQGRSITVSRMKRRHCHEPWRLHKLYASRVQFYCTSTAASPCQTHKYHQYKKKHVCTKFLSLMRHPQQHFCLQSNLFKAALSLSLCIQELILQCPRDEFLCLRRGNKLSSVGLEGLSIPHRGCFFCQCVDFIWWKNKLYLKLIKWIVNGQCVLFNCHFSF